MDLVPSTQSDLLRGDLSSPVRGTRTRAVREYEETIEKLRKEKFDLQLRLYMLEEGCLKNPQKNKGISNDELDNRADIVVHLSDETEALKAELNSKDQLLHEAWDQAKRYESDFKELQDKYVELQEQLTSVSNNLLQLEWNKLKDEKENFEKESEHLRIALSETEKVIQEANAQIEELTNKNQALEAKASKKSLAIQGLVYKYHKDVEMIPKELRPIVQEAVQAAKQCKEEDLNAALGELKASLSKIMPVSVEEVSNDTEFKENEGPSGIKRSKKSHSANQSSQSSRQADTKQQFVHVRKRLFKPK